MENDKKKLFIEKNFEQAAQDLLTLPDKPISQKDFVKGLQELSKDKEDNPLDSKHFIEFIRLSVSYIASEEEFNRRISSELLPTVEEALELTKPNDKSTKELLENLKAILIERQKQSQQIDQKS